MIDAVESAGLLTDGRLLALNSFENRVYQVGMEDSPPLVAKFYRAGRWSDAAILEEHAFAAELDEAELPVVAPIKVENSTLLHHGGFRFALYPRQGGRAPELESADNLAWVGRLLARMHGVGSRGRFRHAARSIARRSSKRRRRSCSLPPLLPDTVRDRYARVVGRTRSR